MCASLRFDSDMLLAGRIIRTGEKDFRLLLMANHVATDAISFQRIIDDIDDWLSCDDREEWQPAPSSSFGGWTQLLNENENVFVDQLDYWKNAMSVGSPIQRHGEMALTANSEHFRSLSASLSGEKIRQVEDQIKSAKWSMQKLLVAAFSRSLAYIFAVEDFRIFMEGHGRENLDPKFDFSRTTGWFTSLYPVRISTGRVNDIKETLRQIPTGGIGYGHLRYNGNTEVELESSGHEVLLNFLGKSSAVDRRSRISRPLKLHRSSELQRKFAVEVAIYLDDKLQWDVSYRQDLISEATASQLSNQFKRNIEELGLKIIEDSDSKSASDFPLANLDSRQLGDLAAILNQKNKPTD
jgi:non-ribosomal peptide synthase protein (TIGR01720 family)